MNKHEKRQKSILPGGIGIKVVTSKFHPNGDITYALRSFKKEMKEYGILDEFKNRKHHISKSAKKRKMMERAKYFQQVSDMNRG